VKAAPGELRIADWLQLQPQVDPIRERVFVGEQGIAPAVVWDPLDADAVHAVVLSAGDAVGCCRLRRVGDRVKLERMAVLAAERRRGRGRELVEGVLCWAQARSLTGVVLHSQMSASGFYLRCGFRKVGEPFLEAGILHQAMEFQFDDASQG
jgi:predicted GNAT family N-acyltransferase